MLGPCGKFNLDSLMPRCKLMEYLWLHNKQKGLFIESLPVSGVNLTLKWSEAPGGIRSCRPFPRQTSPSHWCTGQEHHIVILHTSAGPVGQELLSGSCMAFGMDSAVSR